MTLTHQNQSMRNASVLTFCFCCGLELTRLVLGTSNYVPQIAEYTSTVEAFPEVRWTRSHRIHSQREKLVQADAFRRRSVGVGFQVVTLLACRHAIGMSYLQRNRWGAVPKYGVIRSENGQLLLLV